MIPDGLNQPFYVIGENIHTTRSFLREGKLVVTSPAGYEAVRYSTSAGETRYLKIPEDFKLLQAYMEGKVKHVMIAVRSGMSGEPAEAEEARLYLRSMVERQIRMGADFLDLNVDEISWNRDEQKAAMDWLVRTVEPWSSVPLSIDSSNLEILLTGIHACRNLAGKPLLNSASLERLDALEIVSRYDLPVVITASGRSGMPQSAAERVEYASEVVETALAKGIPLERMYVDALVFPISVDDQFVNHCLDAFRQLRAKYGKRIHLTGGLSNVSFGMPCRKLINEVFIKLAVDAGADSGIVDPVTSNLNRIFRTNFQSHPCELALDMLVGRDPGCMNFLAAHREGELELATSGPV